MGLSSIIQRNTSSIFSTSVWSTFDSGPSVALATPATGGCAAVYRAVGEVRNECGSHRRTRAPHAGELLTTAVCLVGRTSRDRRRRCRRPARRPAPAASATGRRSRRARTVRPADRLGPGRSPHGRHRVTRAAECAQTSPRRASSNVRCRTWRPTASAQSRVSRARAASRATTVTEPTPRSARATSAGRAVPPAPITTAGAPERSPIPPSTSARGPRRRRCSPPASRRRCAPACSPTRSRRRGRCVRSRTRAPPPSRHRHRQADPLGPETRHQTRQLFAGALDPLVRPVGQPERTIGSEVQVRGLRMRDRATENGGLPAFTGRHVDHLPLSRMPLFWASSMFARCSS